MEECGRHFVAYVERYLADSGSPLQLTSLGRNLRHFLNYIDNLHEYVRPAFPAMRAPSFYCETISGGNGDPGIVLLHYRSQRPGFVPYVVGQIREVARRYYRTDVVVDVVCKKPAAAAAAAAAPSAAAAAAVAAASGAGESPQLTTDQTDESEQRRHQAGETSERSRDNCCRDENPTERTADCGMRRPSNGYLQNGGRCLSRTNGLALGNHERDSVEQNCENIRGWKVDTDDSTSERQVDEVRLAGSECCPLLTRCALSTGYCPDVGATSAKASFKSLKNPSDDTAISYSKSIDDSFSVTDHWHDIDKTGHINHEAALVPIVPGNGNDAPTSTRSVESSATVPNAEITATAAGVANNNASLTEVVIRLRLEKMSDVENEDDNVNDYVNDDCDDGDDNDDDDGGDDDHLSPIPDRLANIDAQLFLDAFPFHVLFDRDTIITSVGSGLEAVVSPSVVGRRVNEAFRLTRPLVQFNWYNVSVSCHFFRPFGVKSRLWHLHSPFNHHISVKLRTEADDFLNQPSEHRVDQVHNIECLTFIFLSMSNIKKSFSNSRG
jgi:hypothetical protein